MVKSRCLAVEAEDSSSYEHSSGLAALRFSALRRCASAVYFGIALISSAIAGNPTLAGHPKRQTIFLIIGLVILFLAASFDYHIWTTLSKPFYVVVALLLLVVSSWAQHILERRGGLRLVW